MNHRIYMKHGTFEVQGPSAEITRPQPTEEGMRRYDDPPAGFYEGEPCTCSKDCVDPCKGACGCRACSMSYSDDLSSDYD